MDHIFGKIFRSHVFDSLIHIHENLEFLNQWTEMPTLLSMYDITIIQTQNLQRHNGTDTGVSIVRTCTVDQNGGNIAFLAKEVDILSQPKENPVNLLVICNFLIVKFNGIFWSPFNNMELF